MVGGFECWWGKKFSPYLSIPALEPNQPRVQWLLGPLARECSTRGMMCTTHPSTAEVQHKWCYTCTFPLCPHWYITGWLLLSPFCRRNVIMGYDNANWCIGTDVAEDFAAFVCKWSTFVAIYQSTLLHIPEDCNLYQHRCENLKSQNVTA